jgi:hypothetical protein
MMPGEYKNLMSLSDDAIELFYEVFECNVRSEGIYESIALAWETLKEEKYI